MQPKTMRLLGYGLLVLGTVSCLTIIGIIPGIFILAGGAVFVVSSKKAVAPIA